MLKIEFLASCKRIAPAEWNRCNPSLLPFAAATFQLIMLWQSPINRIRFPFAAVSAAGLSLLFSAQAQDSALPEASATQTALKEWVQTRQLISREASDWQEQQGSLTQLNDIRKIEIKNLEEFVTAAGERVEEIDEKRQDYVEEEAELKAWRNKLTVQIAEIENSLRPLLPYFPTPLRAKVQEAVVRLEESEPGRPLQHRTRDVLLIMQAYQAFNNNISLDAEVRLIDGEKREIEILYLGMTQAWFVDQSGRYAGYGLPSQAGWPWVDAPALAAPVRQAIEIQTRQAPPAFISLPIANGNNANP